MNEYKVYTKSSWWRIEADDDVEAMRKALWFCYRDDEEFFFDLFFKDNSNYLFITLVHGGIIEDFEFDEKYIQFGCDDEIKGMFIEPGGLPSTGLHRVGHD